MKKILTILFCLIILPPAYGQNSFTFSSFYPAPVGFFNQLRLVPRNTLPDPCPQGTFYIPNDTVPSRPYYCYTRNGTPVWGYLDGIWNQEGMNIFTMDLTVPTDLKVQIGYALGSPFPSASGVPELSIGDYRIPSGLGQDGGILASGVYGKGSILPELSTVIPVYGAGSYFIWYPRTASIRAGYSSGTWDNSQIGDTSVAFGQDTTASGAFSTVSGGLANTASGSHASVGGGNVNTASAQDSTVVGGLNNTVSGDYGFIGGGEENTVAGAHSAIGGGYMNHVFSTFSSIGGGKQNLIDNLSDWSIIIGGNQNKIEQSQYAVIGGGGVPDATTRPGNHIVKSNYSFIGGGDDNTITSSDAATYTHNAIGGGQSHAITDSHHSSIGGGFHNTITSANYSFIGGGSDNSIVSVFSDSADYTADNSAIGGGYKNNIYAKYGFIGGGSQNTVGDQNCPTIDRDKVFGVYAAIGGGELNKAFGNYSFIGGGKDNQAKAPYSVILGGEHNIVDTNADYSWAGGRHITVTGARTFAWGYHAGIDQSTAASQNDTFIIAPSPSDADGGINIVLFGEQQPQSPIYWYSPGLNINADAVSVALRISGNLFILTPLESESAAGLPVKGKTAAGSDQGTLVHEDLAETFETAESVTAGDVLVVDPKEKRKVRISSTAYDKKVVGIASRTPAILLEGDTMLLGPGDVLGKNGQAPVAVSGRVICKVSLENEPIEYGDLLTTASLAGHAMKSTDDQKAFGAIVAKALAPFTGGPKGEKQGMIPVFVNLQ